MDTSMQAAIAEAAMGHGRLLRALGNWRALMPDDLLRAAVCAPEDALPAFLRAAPRVDPAWIGHRQLLPHVHHSLASLIADHPLEPLLRAHRLRSGIKARKLLLERDQIRSDLEAAGIDPLFFKGAVLAFSVYPAPCCRTVGDIDILVRENVFDHACATLSRWGWRMRDAGADEPSRWKSRFAPGTSFYHPDFLFSIDLHTQIHHHQVPVRIAESYWHASTEAGPSGGGAVRSLCDEHAVLHVCCHGLAQNYYPPVRWATDAVWLLRAAGDRFDWDRLLGAARESRSGAILGLALTYLKDVLGEPGPPEVLSQSRPLGLSRSFASYWSYRLDRPEDLRERCGFFLVGFREAHHSQSLLGSLRQFPAYLRETQGTATAAAGALSLLRKAVARNAAAEPLEDT